METRITTELKEEHFHEAREKLKEKGELHLGNFLNACIDGNLKDANEYKKLFIQAKEHIDFIDGILEKL